MSKEEETNEITEQIEEEEKTTILNSQSTVRWEMSQSIC